MSRFDLFFVIVDECNEIVDNAIAKRIIDLHCDNWQGFDTVYSQSEIARYINFAKHFKPMLNQVLLYSVLKLLLFKLSVLIFLSISGSGRFFS